MESSQMRMPIIQRPKVKITDQTCQVCLLRKAYAHLCEVFQFKSQITDSANEKSILPSYFDGFPISIR